MTTPAADRSTDDSFVSVSFLPHPSLSDVLLSYPSPAQRATPQYLVNVRDECSICYLQFSAQKCDLRPSIRACTRAQQPLPYRLVRYVECRQYLRNACLELWSKGKELVSCPCCHGRLLDIGERAEKRWLEGINEGIEIGRWNALRTLDLPEVLGNEDEERMR